MGPPHREFQEMNAGGGLMPRSLGAAAREEGNMLKEFVEKIISLAEPSVRVEEDGRIYSDKKLLEVQLPSFTPVTVHTLAGLRDLYKFRDQQTAAPTFIQIEDHTTVSLVAKEVDEWRRRAIFVHATVPSDAPRFRFGVWMDPEEFVVGMQTLFEDAEYGTDHKKIIKLVSGLAAEAVTISNDDGVSQQVVTRQGMVTKADEKVSPRVSLAPFRTFREVSQPSTDFIMRLRSRQGQMPSCALFEADGGEWKTTAMKYIREYFQKELPDADIVA